MDLQQSNTVFSPGFKKVRVFSFFLSCLSTCKIIMLVLRRWLRKCVFVPFTPKTVVNDNLCSDSKPWIRANLSLCLLTNSRRDFLLVYSLAHPKHHFIHSFNKNTKKNICHHSLCCKTINKAPSSVYRERCQVSLCEFRGISLGCTGLKSSNTQDPVIQWK